MIDLLVIGGVEFLVLSDNDSTTNLLKKSQLLITTPDIGTSSDR